MNAANSTRMKSVVMSETGRAGLGSSVMMRQALRNPGITNGNEFRGGITAQVGPRADAADADHRGQDPKDIEREEGLGVTMGVLEGREHVVAQVDEDRAQAPNRDAPD